MFASRSISARLTLAITALIVVTCAVLGGFSIVEQRDQTRRALDGQLTLAYQGALATFESEGRAALAVGEVIAGLPPVDGALAAGDRGMAQRLLAGAQAALRSRGIAFMTITQAPATAFLRVHQPEAFGDDVSARRASVVAVMNSGEAVAGVEPGRDTLAIFAVTPIRRDGKTVAVADIGVPLGNEFAERVKQRLGVDLAIDGIDGASFKPLASTLGPARLAAPEELKRALEGAMVRRDATLDGHPVAMLLGQIRNFAGQPVAVIELIKDVTAFEAAAARARDDLVLGTGAVLVVAVILAGLLGRGISRPIRGITTVMNRLSAGETDVAIQGDSRRDEVGVMARAVRVFKDGMIANGRLRAEQDAIKHHAEQERRAMLLDLANRFESAIGGIAADVTSQASDLHGTADVMTSAADESARRAASVAASSGDATRNINTVAAATEELSSSVQEISRQTGLAARMIGMAVAEATSANTRVESLAEAARKIGEVVRMISAIASQTNLLALNATIEAARAGDAGKGFAVVASEVKALANQTAKATDEITTQIAAIQAATLESVGAIQGIAATIDKVSETTTSIASAIEEQGAATREIARNVAEAAAGTANVTSNMSALSVAARRTGEAASSVLAATGGLSGNSHALKSQVDAFLLEIRAA